MAGTRVPLAEYAQQASATIIRSCKRDRLIFCGPTSAQRAQTALSTESPYKLSLWDQVFRASNLIRMSMCYDQCGVHSPKPAPSTSPAKPCVTYHPMNHLIGIANPPERRVSSTPLQRTPPSMSGTTRGTRGSRVAQHFVVAARPAYSQILRALAVRYALSPRSSALHRRKYPPDEGDGARNCTGTPRTP